MSNYILYIILLLTGLVGTYAVIPFFKNMLIASNVIRPNYKKDMIPVSMGLVFLPMIVINGIILAIFTTEYKNLLYLFMYIFGLIAMCLVGILDDIIGNRDVSGLKGHFKCLFKGNLTTGGFKALFGGFVGILISVFGCINGYLLTGPRITYTLGAAKTLPAALGKLSKNGSPVNATLAMAVLSCLYALSGQFNLLTDLSIFAVWVFYTLTFIGVIKLRKDQPNLHRPYKVPLYPIVPIVAIACGVFVVVNQLFLSGMTNTIISLGGLVITLIGLPVYSYMNKKNAASESTEKAA